jgi:hypothetical protein
MTFSTIRFQATTPAPMPRPAASAAPAAPPRRASLRANPLFAEGADNDELQLDDDASLEFAKANFTLDDAFVGLVSSKPAGVHFSLVYHSDDKGNAVLDAYRAVAGNGAKSAFAAYAVVNPQFDPGKAYRNELITPLGNGRAFSTLLTSRRLTVPDNATPATVQYLADHGYQQKEAEPLSSVGLSPAFQKFFAMPPDMGLHMYDMQKRSFSEKFSMFYHLCQDSPEYLAYKMGDFLDNVGSAMLLGVITPKLWEQGAAYGIASTISSIGNIGSPAIGIIGESFLGSVVDKAVNSPRPIESLKKLKLATAGLGLIKNAAQLGTHPALLKAFPHPGAAFIGLYSTSTFTGSISGVISGKADLAIHDQLINKSGLNPEYSRNYYQIIGVEASLARGLYLGSYSAAVAAVAAMPALSVPLAAAGAALWSGSGFVWSLYHQKPDVRVTVPGKHFVHKGENYVFDSGWEVAFKGEGGQIVPDGKDGYTISLNGGGQLALRNDEHGGVKASHHRRLKDYLPRFLKPKILGEKENWKLDNGSGSVVVSRFANRATHVDRTGENEYTLTV